MPYYEVIRPSEKRISHPLNMMESLQLLDICMNQFNEPRPCAEIPRIGRTFQNVPNGCVGCVGAGARGEFRKSPAPFYLIILTYLPQSY